MTNWGTLWQQGGRGGKPEGVANPQKRRLTRLSATIARMQTTVNALDPATCQERFKTSNEDLDFAHSSMICAGATPKQLPDGHSTPAGRPRTCCAICCYGQRVSCISPLKLKIPCLQ